MKIMKKQTSYILHLIFTYKLKNLPMFLEKVIEMYSRNRNVLKK